MKRGRRRWEQLKRGLKIIMGMRRRMGVRCCLKGRVRWGKALRPTMGCLWRIVRLGVGVRGRARTSRAAGREIRPACYLPVVDPAPDLSHAMVLAGTYTLGSADPNGCGAGTDQLWLTGPDPFVGRCGWRGRRSKTQSKTVAATVIRGRLWVGHRISARRISRIPVRCCPKMLRVRLTLMALRCLKRGVSMNTVKGCCVRRVCCRMVVERVWCGAGGVGAWAGAHGQSRSRRMARVRSS